MKNIIRACVLVLGLAAGHEAFAGIPVIDTISNEARAAEFLKTVKQWATEISHMEDQYTMLTNQYTQLKNSYESANGLRSWGNVANNTYDKVGTWSSKMSSVDYSQYKDAAQVLGVDDAPFTSTSDAGISMTNIQNTNAYNRALNEENYARIKARQSSLETLMGQVNNATDQKDIADLHARISAEQTMLANEQNNLMVTAQLQQGQRDIQQEQDRERLMKMSELKNVSPY
jgi:type IV secretion system protein VirB5